VTDANEPTSAGAASPTPASTDSAATKPAALSARSKRINTVMWILVGCVAAAFLAIAFTLM
jgi:hypothetical protein